MKNLILAFVFITLTGWITHPPGGTSKAIEVKGAGIEAANGIYLGNGTFNDHPKYVKDSCVILYKGCRSKWMLKMVNQNLYKNATDSDDCPTEDWKVACGAKSISSIVPEFTIINE